MANLFSDVEQGMKCWLNCSDIKWNNLKGNNKHLIKRRKCTEIPGGSRVGFFLLSH